MDMMTASCPDWLESCFNVDHHKAESHEDETNRISEAPSRNFGNQSPEERKNTYTRLRSASRPHSTPQTLKWLEDNYEIADGVCIPRSTLYVHYLDYCEKNDTQPVNAASFGKIIRQQFPQITTRRLGTRGQSKYHYYGIGVRETSTYYELAFSAKAEQASTEGKKDTTKQIVAYSPRSKLGTLLPDFPNIKEIKLPPTLSEEKVLTFLMMYRTHCQRILDTVIRANFDEVQSFLLHFWQGMPTHIKTILESTVLVTLVGVCDSILYRAIANVLMPTVLQPLPESLTQVIRHFSTQLDDWLHQALHSLPKRLQRVKFDLARGFSQVLKRQTSLNHLCQAARTVINSAEITSQMLDDWFNIDLNSIIKQTLYTAEWGTDLENTVIVKIAHDFETLLEDQCPLESYIDWLDAMVNRCVTQIPVSLQKTARQFLLMWSCIGTRIIRDMTLHSAPSFGSFHLLHLMFDEYVMYIVEHLHSQEKSQELLRAAKGEISSDFLDEILTPEPPNRSAICIEIDEDIDDINRTTVLRPDGAGIFQNTPIDCVSTTNTTLCYGGSQMEPTTFQQNTAKHNSEDLSTTYPAFPHPSCQSVPYNPTNFSNTSSAHAPDFTTCTSGDVNNTFDSYEWQTTASQPFSTRTVTGKNMFNQSAAYKGNSHIPATNQSFPVAPACTDAHFKRHNNGDHLIHTKKYTDSRLTTDKPMTGMYPYPTTNIM